MSRILISVAAIVGILAAAILSLTFLSHAETKSSVESRSVVPPPPSNSRPAPPHSKGEPRGATTLAFEGVTDLPPAKDETAPVPPKSKHSRPKADPPLKHAIIHDEEDSPEKRIHDALGKSIDIDFIETPLEDCLAFFHEQHDINIWIDKSSITDEGVAIDQPVTLKLSGVRLESILGLLLEPLQLEWVVEHEVLQITTAVKAAQKLSTLNHPIHYLLDSGHAPDELIEAITKCVAPESWADLGGPGSIAHTGGVLVVRQTQKNHSEIEHLLSDLDDIAAEEEEHNPRDKPVVTLRAYPVDQLEAVSLAQSIPDLIAPGSWDAKAGPGTIRAVAGALLVNHTPLIHGEIRRLLKELHPKQSPFIGPIRTVPSHSNSTPATSISDVERSTRGRYMAPTFPKKNSRQNPSPPPEAGEKSDSPP